MKLMKTKPFEIVALGILLSYCIFHILILLQVIPFTVVWGGKITSFEKIVILEGVALVVMLFLSIVLAMKVRLLKPVLSDRTLKLILLVFAVFFLLNTFGNLLAESVIEKMQAIITIYLAIVFYISSKK